MTRRGWTWVAALAAADVLAWALTLHAQLSFHAPPGGQVTSLGIVLGWLASVVFAIAIALMLLAGRQATKYQRGTAVADPGSAAAPPATGAAGGAA
jgi:hypothetical protein